MYTVPSYLYQQDVKKKKKKFFWSSVNVCFVDGLHSKMKPVLQRTGMMCSSLGPFPCTADSFIHSLRVLTHY